MLETDKTPEAKAILDFVERRINKKLACNIIFTGELGKGKSYSGIRLLELWHKRRFDEEFPITHICETLNQAVMIVKDFKRGGEGILIEELSVLAGSRESLTRLNRLWNKFMDTCRIKQAVIVGNAPFLNFVDKHIIALSQLWIEALGVNFRKKFCVCKPLILQPSQKKVYFHHLVDDEGDEIDLCYFKKPSEGLIKSYDELKMNSVNDLYEEIAQRMHMERKKQLKELGRKELSPKQQEAYDLYLEGIEPKEAYKKMGLNMVQTYYKYLNNAKKKIKEANIGKKPKEIKQIEPANQLIRPIN